MNITQNVQTESKPRELYWGLANMLTKVINPTLAELKDMGYTKDEEPDYLIRDTENNVTGCRIDIYLKYASSGKDDDRLIDTKISYRVLNKEFASEKTGKFQFINKEGKSAWAESEATLNDTFTSPGGVRKALQSEASLLEFMRCFFDIKAGQNCEIPLSAWREELFKGNFKSIKNLVKGYPTNKVRFILGINEYTKQDGSIAYAQSCIANLPYRPYQKHNEYMDKAINYYLENTESKYLIMIPAAPYNLAIWSPTQVTSLDEGIVDEIPW